MTGNYFANGVLVHNCHRIKANNGRTSKFFAELRPRCRDRLGMSGTVLPHDHLDAFGSFRFMDPGIFGVSFTSFKRLYTNPHPHLGEQVPHFNPRTGDWFRSAEVRADFQQRYASITFKVGEEVLDLPPYQDVDRRVELPAAALKAYRKLWRELVAEVESYDRAKEAKRRGEKVVVSAANAMVRVTRCQQLLSGFIVEEDTNEQVEIHTAREDALVEVFDEIGRDEPVVVFARFTRDVQNAKAAWRRYSNMIGEDGWAAEVSGSVDEMAAFKRGETNCCVLQMEAGSESVDLTRARYAVYYSCALKGYKQSRARVRRVNQTRPVTYVHLIAGEDLVDGIIRASHEGRGEALERIMAAARRTK